MKIIDAIYQARKSRLTHPEGTFDKAGRFYPSDRERCECCDAVRSPSRAYPYSYMAHCRTKKHIAALVEKLGERDPQLRREAKQCP